MDSTRSRALVESVASTIRVETARYYSSMASADRLRLEIDEITQQVYQASNVARRLDIHVLQDGGKIKTSRSVYRQPLWVSGILGSLLGSFDLTIYRPAEPTTTNSTVRDRSIEYSVSYVPPPWLADRALGLTATKSSFGWSLVFTIFPPQLDDSIWRAIRQGNLEWLGRFFPSRFSRREVIMSRDCYHCINTLSVSLLTINCVPLLIEC